MAGDYDDLKKELEDARDRATRLGLRRVSEILDYAVKTVDDDRVTPNSPSRESGSGDV